MRKRKCNKDCLNCLLPKCVHDIEDRSEDIRERYEKIRHAEYYKNNRNQVIEKAKEYNSKNRTSEKCRDYYLRHKTEINRKRRERYSANREKEIAQNKAYYQAHKEDILRRRKEKRKNDKQRKTYGACREPQELGLECLSTVQA